MWITTSEESNSCLSLLIWSLHYSDLLFCSISLSLSLSLVPAFWWLTRRASFSPFLHFRNAKDAYENKKRNTSNCVSMFLFLSLHADKGARMHTTKSINSNSPRWGVPLSLSALAWWVLSAVGTNCARQVQSLTAFPSVRTLFTARLQLLRTIVTTILWYY